MLRIALPLLLSITACDCFSSTEKSGDPDAGTDAGPGGPDPVPADTLCREFADEGTAFLEGTQGPWARLRAGLHWLLCAGCRAYLAQLRATRDLLGKLGGEAPATAPSPALLGALAEVPPAGPEDPEVAG